MMPVEQLIFTDWPRGKGADPTATGFQIKACSAGLSEEARRQLASICMHIGEAYTHSHAPRAATEGEQAWLAQTDSRENVPKPVLDAFPEIWSYDQLADDLFALTRVRYTCLTHDGRTGNFLAHALVFKPDDLDPFGGNPLAASRSERFQAPDSGGNITLTTYQNLGASTSVEPRYEALRTAPYSDRLEEMISALCTATPSTRPVLLCLADWRQATPLVKELLGLLPRATRRRTTVSTYESDRSWVMPTQQGRPTGMKAAHHLLVLCGPEDRSLNLRPDEYQSLFAVFNFVEGQFSELEEPRDFARLAAGCVKDKRMDRLARHHELVEELGLEQDADAWDALVPAVALADTQPGPKALVEATKALAGLATRPEQAEKALDRLLPSIRSLAEADDAATLKTLATGLSTLADRFSEASQEAVERFLTPMRDLSGKALDEGRVHTASALLAACGQARDGLLLQLLHHALSEPSATVVAPANADERGQWVDLLLDGLRLAEVTPDAAPPFAQLVVATFRVAKEAGRVTEIWASVGESLVKARLDGEWNAEKESLARKLETCVPVDQCPEANGWLNLKLLKATKPKGKDLYGMLAKIVEANAQSTDADKRTADLLRIVQEQLPDAKQQAVALGHMVNAARNTASENTFFEEYRAVVRQAKHAKKIHDSLAKEGASYVLCLELLEEVLPWNEPGKSNKFKSWNETVLKRHPRVMDELRLHVAGQLGQAGQAEDVLPLAQELLSRRPDKSASSPGLVRLYEAVVFALPLEPLSKNWNDVLAPFPDNPLPNVETRLRILKFMRRIKREADNSDWDTTKFPYKESVWQDDVRALSHDEKTRVLAWCIKTFFIRGVTTPAEAQGLTWLLGAAGKKSPDDIADAVDQLLRGRDPVTRVQVATAFAWHALEGSKRGEGWRSIVGAIVSRFDKNNRRLFGAHLEHRFGPRGPNYDERLEQLRDAIRRSKPAAPAKALEAREGPGIIDSIKQLFRGLVGGSETPAKPAERRERKKPR